MDDIRNAIEKLIAACFKQLLSLAVFAVFLFNDEFCDIVYNLIGIVGTKGVNVAFVVCLVMLCLLIGFLCHLTYHIRETLVALKGGTNSPATTVIPQKDFRIIVAAIMSITVAIALISDCYLFFSILHAVSQEAANFTWALFVLFVYLLMIAVVIWYFYKEVVSPMTLGKLFESIAYCIIFVAGSLPVLFFFFYPIYLIICNTI